jgi:predicted O-methyltransferase YrrM
VEKKMSDQNAFRPVEEIFEIINAIPENTCGVPQPRFLFDLSLKCKGAGTVVEIGTCAGKSTIALAYAQQTQGRAPIHTIDIVEHDKIKENLSRAGVAAYVNRIIRSSSEVAASWSDPVELLWIDGDHSYNGVLQDIACWADKVLPGGFMAFHDYPSPGGKALGAVGRAVYKKIHSRPDRWRVIADRQAGSILAFERLQLVEQAESGYAANFFEKLIFFVAGMHRRASNKFTKRH